MLISFEFQLFFIVGMYLSNKIYYDATMNKMLSIMYCSFITKFISLGKKSLNIGLFFILARII